jgi:predicted anti-sigma-YlaC factor YlaD
MTDAGCDKEALSSYALGALESGDHMTVVRHLDRCAACRMELAEFEEVISMLGELPPEALLSGPPDTADLVLRRALRTMRTEVSGMRRRRLAVVGAIAAGVIAASLASGAALGRNTAPQADPVSLVTTIPSESLAGVREGSVTDPGTSTALTVKLVPATGWVRVNVSVRGIPAGENCRLIVVSRGGAREVAAGWIASEAGQHDGTVLDGTSGRKFVSLKI